MPKMYLTSLICVTLDNITINKKYCRSCVKILAPFVEMLVFTSSTSIFEGVVATCEWRDFSSFFKNEIVN